MEKRKVNKKTLIYFFIILIIGVVFNEKVFENKHYIQAHVWERHFLYTLALITTGILGNLSFNKMNAGWVSALWKIFYFFSFILLLIAAFIDLYAYHYSDAVRRYFIFYRAILISPVPFVIVHLFFKYNKINSSNIS